MVDDDQRYEKNPKPVDVIGAFHKMMKKMGLSWQNII